MAIGILHRIEQGELKDEVPIASDVIHNVLSRRVLYVALFLHDIAKGRGGDHSTLGAHDVVASARHDDAQRLNLVDASVGAV